MVVFDPFIFSDFVGISKNDEMKLLKIQDIREYGE